MAEKLNVEIFLEECRESGDKAYNALKGVLELLQNPSTRVEARIFLSTLQKITNHSSPSESLAVYHFRIHHLSLTGYEGFREDRQSLTLLELPSIFIPEDWSFTFFEGINRLPDSVFRDRDVAELGCGNGWISIALAEKWSPRKMYGLDINPRAIKAAWINLYLNALNEDGSPVVDHEGKTLLDRVEFHESDLLAYCRTHNISLDRIVGCIPQILNPDPHAMQKIVSENASEEFLYSLSNYCALQGFVEDQFGLGLIARAVEEGISVVRPSGTMIFNIGGRPGQAVCERLFERRGFRISKLWQTRVNQAPDTDILALVEIENNSRHRFEFFMGRVSEEPISARTAYAYSRCGGEISHGLSVYSCQLHQPNQVKTIFKFLSKSLPETRGALDLSFKDDSVADEKIPFLAHLARALELTASIPYELPVGNTRFRNLIAGFLCSYHDIPISQNNIIVYPSRAVAIEHFLCLFSPELALVDGSLTKLLPHKWLTTFSAEQFASSPRASLFGTDITVIEAPKRADLILKLLLMLKPQVVVSSLADFEMKSSTAFERLLDACSQFGARLLLDISDHIELSSLPGTNGVLQYLSAQALPSHATIVCGLLKNKVYSDLEVAFVVSENKEVLDLMGKMGELLIGGTAISSQFYYGCLFQELLAFQLPGRHTKPNRMPLKEAEAHFIKVPAKTQECLEMSELSIEEQGSEGAFTSSVENLLATPKSVTMAIFESFARQNISEMETNPTTEMHRFVKGKVGIPADFSSNIVLSDSSKALFSKLVVGCRDNGGTLFFPVGSNEAYIYAAKLLGVDVRMIETRAETSFKVTESIADETFATSEKSYLYISGPTIYPTGLVYLTSEIKALISACSKHGAHVIVDTSFSGLEFNSSGAVTWDLQDVNCSNVTLFGNFSSPLLVGGLEFGYALVQDSFSSSFNDLWNISKPHGTLRYTMQKLLRLYNDNDITLLEELNEQRKSLHQRAESLCQVLQDSGWEPVKPSGGVSLIARPVAYEGKKFCYKKLDGLTTEIELCSSNIMKAILDVTKFHFSNTSSSCIPGYCQFGFSLKEQDFLNCLDALKKMKEVGNL
ncbi:hypothetical protein GOP47_0013054 [Adiantum capillus-veneris]|uniref:Methionine S-methyltransferase n=1 Tax=Adiantum capillus-veneris TaxID=13818 RepID=A0A9D4UT84_ADICA|nr:hypothetical protein GOP47_0013054 [Adiantum capillus-veneris]